MFFFKRVSFVQYLLFSGEFQRRVGFFKRVSFVQRGLFSGERNGGVSPAGSGLAKRGLSGWRGFSSGEWAS